jgi:hypothetical protein
MESDGGSGGGGGEGQQEAATPVAPTPPPPPPPPPSPPPLALTAAAAASCLDTCLLLYHLAVAPELKEAGLHQQRTAKRARAAEAAAAAARRNAASSSFSAEDLAALVDASRLAAWNAARLYSGEKTAGLCALSAYVARLLAALATGVHAAAVARFNGLLAAQSARIRAAPPAFPSDLSACTLVTDTSAQLEALIAEVAQKYVHTRRIELDGMLALLTTLNAKGALPSGMSIASGGFLLLYNMLQGATQCRLHSSNCSQVCTTTLMATE